MATTNWNRDRAEKRIAARIAEVETVTLKNYVRDTDLSNLPHGVAYKIDAVHIYVDILNMPEMLGTTGDEGKTCHRRALRFLNLHFRAVHRILNAVDAIEVDFHNQRLHAVVAKPYSDPAARVHRAVAIGRLVVDVLAQTGEIGDEIIPAATIRVGIDTGLALAVNNGRRGHREPLFLGNPANCAAKLASAASDAGLFMSNAARRSVGWAPLANPSGTPLNPDEISISQADASLDVTVEQIVKAWRLDLETNPIGRFEFSGHTPPFSDLDLEALSPSNSRRQEAMSIYADIDGFTAYVAAHVTDDETVKDVVRALHVIRSELDSVLSSDFGGRKIRFIGDCVHGVLGEGTAQTTDAEATVTSAVLCAGALRSSFSLALEKLKGKGVNVSELGLAIGLEFGPIAITRLGMKGSMMRCAIGRGVLASEARQRLCDGDETALGPVALKKGNPSVRDLFAKGEKLADLDYDEARKILQKQNDSAASTAKSATPNGNLLKPAGVATTQFSFPPRPVTPTKPAGFA